MTEPIWIMATREPIRICDMRTVHLIRTIRLLTRGDVDFGFRDRDYRQRCFNAMQLELSKRDDVRIDITELCAPTDVADSPSDYIDAGIWDACMEAGPEDMEDQ